MQYFRVLTTVAISLAMMLPGEIFAECCCSANKSGCCAVKAPVEAPKPSCCNCERIAAEQAAVLECVTLRIGNQERPSCECCLRARLNSSAVPVTLKKVDLNYSIFARESNGDGGLPQLSTKNIETASYATNNNKRQALLCVWIQ